jgi:hypothetical protein
MLEKPIFLVGAERSGTTLLRLMLSYHPQITWCNEFEYAVDKIEEKNQFPDLVEYQQWLETHRIFQATEFMIDSHLTYPELINSFLLQKRDREKKEIIGATVHRHFDKLLFIWPDARFIHLIRDGRDVAKSCIGMGWAGNVYQGVERWETAEKLWAHLSSQLTPDRYVEITYEDLIYEPEKTLGNVCKFIGVEYSKLMLSYAKKTTYDVPNSKLIAQWKSKLSAHQIQLIESKVSDLLRKKGYQLSGLPIIKLNSFQKKKLIWQDWLYRAYFRLKRYGFWLFMADFLSRKLNLNSWQKKVKLKINQIDTKYLK